MNVNFLNKLKEIIPEENIKLKEPLKNHTTFHIGGPAEYFILPASEKEIKASIQCAVDSGIPWYIIGNGSNLLAADSGYPGLIIKMDQNMGSVDIKEQPGDACLVYAQAGILLSKLANMAAGQSLAGLEFASGIPGSLGGAITMNAGAYGGEIKDSLIKIEVLDKDGTKHSIQKDDAQFGYRTSIVQKKNMIVLSGEFLLKKGIKDNIYNTMKELNRRRKEKQPLEYASGGSTFKRPDGYFAGKLIMDSGLAGYRVGDIMISEKHCGFVINTGHGTASEVKKLIQDVQKIVFEKQGVWLEPEIRMLGRFD